MSKKLVIVGGGYGGIRLARELDEVMDVTLVEQRDQFVHNIALMRAVVDPSWLGRILLPYDRLLRRGQVVRDTAVGVRSGAVSLRDGGELVADQIVLAIGSTYPTPFKGGDSAAALVAGVHDAHARLRTARSVAIIGGGPVGIELAGEIITAFPDKSVTLIAGSDRLLPDYGDRLGRSLERQMTQMGIHVLLGKRALDLIAHAAPFGPASVKLDDQSDLDADLVFPVMGASPATHFLAESKVHLDRHRIVVDSNLSVAGLPGVWSLGDAAGTGEAMTVAALERQVPYLLKRLRAIAKETAPPRSAYKGWKQPPIIVPLGRDKGASLLPLGIVAGPRITSLIKGRHLFAERAVRSLGLADRDGKA
ncbi:FAD-dependent oxidoreductase [Sphingobium sp. LB126]|uniref:FAD-dependent oxidoreductase n=1 Tax=Sphingobium sp. LB126 TaxID=1983755 RepID=UPI0012FE6478|nr:FAD-dependent oxidoreductase [Sphingobium sp. LB126]